jgi:PAS domain S-box-containing protein
MEQIAFIKDAQLRYLFVNLALERFMQKSKEEILGKTDGEIMGPEFAKACEESDRLVLKNQCNVTSHETIGKRFFKTDKFPIALEGGQKGIGAVVLEITQQREAEEALAHEKQTLELFIRSSKIGLWDWDFSNGTVKWDTQSYEMLGYNPDAFELNYEQWAALLHPEDRESAQQELHYQILHGDTFATSFRYKKSDGSWLWVEGRGQVVESHSDGTPKRMMGTHIDISEAKEAQQALLERDELLRKLTEQVPGTLYQFERTPKGESFFPFSSEHIWEIYEVRPDEVRENAAAIFERIHPEDLARVGGSIEVSAANITQWECDYRVVLPLKGTRWLRGAANPERKANGNIIWYGYISDITYHKQIETDLLHAKEQAEAAARAKSSFLSNMSHEIRTPLNAIIGLGELFEETTLDEKQRDLLGKINHSSKLLLRILNDILDYSKIEAGKLEVGMAPLDLHEELQNLDTIFSESARKKGLEFTVTIDEALPCQVFFDGLKLSQILSNLLSNAIKFTTRGMVELQVSVMQKSEKDASVLFCVKDTGIGMNDEEKRMLFEPFTQADISITRKYGGSGLGLSIVKRLVEAMEGSITVHTVQGEGSIFEIRFGMRVLEWNRELCQSIKPTMPNALPQDVWVLLVEDNPINQEVAQMMCERIGAKVSIANNGKEGVELFLKTPERFTCILMDLQMPVMGGYEATEKIRAVDGSVPIIALTAAATTEDKQKVLSAGMNDHLAKPINSKTLHKVLLHWCGAEEMHIKDEDHIEATFGEERQLYQKLLRLFKDQLEDEFGTVVSQIRANDPAIPAVIHSLKGVTGNLGLTRLHRLCCDIDLMYKKGQRIGEALLEDFEKEMAALREMEVEDEVLQDEPLDDKAVLKYCAQIQTQLEDSELVDFEMQAQVYRALRGKVNKDELEAWNKAMARLEYESALVLMEGWSL